jgi:hypothetical protein
LTPPPTERPQARTRHQCTFRTKSNVLPRTTLSTHAHALSTTQCFLTHQVKT